MMARLPLCFLALGAMAGAEPPRLVSPQLAWEMASVMPPFDAAAQEVRVGATAARPAPRAIAANEGPVVRLPAVVVGAPPPEKAVVAPNETTIDRFFRTGIVREHDGRRAAVKLTVGPCEGGELLNLKILW
jgi:hypothetical protein